MRGSRFSEEQIIGVLREQEVGARTEEVCAGGTGSPAQPSPREILNRTAALVRRFAAHDPPMIKDALKLALVRVGPHCSESVIHNLNAAVDYLNVGLWVRRRGFEVSRWVGTGRECFDVIASELGSRQCLYLEFGVASGKALRYWASLLSHPDSLLHGFDSFEGLPEDWNLRVRKGTFSTGGVPPSIDDPRVKCFVGRFDSTLPKYTVPPHDRLVFNMDADLYSSTIYVLNWAAAIITVGTYIYFDEFFDRANELRAFDEFLNQMPQMRFRLVAATATLQKLVFQRVA